MNDNLRKTFWFIGLWLAGVGAATAASLFISMFLS